MCKPFPDVCYVAMPELYLRNGLKKTQTTQTLPDLNPYG